MRISEIWLKNTIDGLNPFCVHSLGNVVVLAGSNGAGKTRLLKLLERYAQGLRANQVIEDVQLKICQLGKEEQILTVENSDELELINYSHYDAHLQSAGRFPTYVICKAKNLLQNCNYGETALNALLLLDDMAHGYSEEFRDGTEFENFGAEFARPFNIQLSKDEENNLQLFGQSVENAALSPGQLYLLRIAVACYCNQANDKLVFLLDEPELHLHPQAQIELIKTLRSKFQNTQFWISTHSMALISYLTVAEKTTTLYLREGNIGILRSDSSDLLEGLIGSEENRFAIRQLFATPDEYACNKFAAECTNPPLVVSAHGNDPQTELVKSIFHENDIIIDFGAGKGRFLEELALATKDDIVKRIHYYAYDPDNKDEEECRQVMEKYDTLSHFYTNDEKELLQVVNGQADYVLLINVLHEIEPQFWGNVFDTIWKMLNDNGCLIIVEREELMTGEAPYENGFLMLTAGSAKELFGENYFNCTRHSEKEYIVKYTVEKEGLLSINERIPCCLEAIKQEAIRMIEEIKHGPPVGTDILRFRKGIQLAFYLHQYANASLNLNSILTGN